MVEVKITKKERAQEKTAKGERGKERGIADGGWDGEREGY